LRIELPNWKQLLENSVIFEPLLFSTPLDVLNLINEVLKVKELVEAAIVSNQDAVTKKLNQVFQEMDTLNHKRQNLELNDPRYVKVIDCVWRIFFDYIGCQNA